MRSEVGEAVDVERLQVRGGWQRGWQGGHRGWGGQSGSRRPEHGAGHHQGRAQHHEVQEARHLGSALGYYLLWGKLFYCQEKYIINIDFNWVLTFLVNVLLPLENIIH